MLDLTDDYLYSSDIIARIDELKDELFQEDGNLVDGFVHQDFVEYEDLIVINEEGEANLEDWIHGANLVAEDVFTDYATDFIQEVHHDIPWSDWPYRHMDWEEAASELKDDYYEITINGYTYLGRCA